MKSNLDKKADIVICATLDINDWCHVFDKHFVTGWICPTMLVNYENLLFVGLLRVAGPNQ